MNRSGLEKSVVIMIVLVIGLAVIITVNSSMKSFFTGSDEANEDNTGILVCDTLCFNCCMYTPKECSGIDAKQDIIDSGCNCKC
ncbi:MAG: hypothetical protein DRN66_02440 [Candidatus Nanohalarchaeota archaeon]|nr:MAG: hypothetical protein DRN66_02440 [Candidatus Nanohaloarchaeota archaeon]